MNVSRFGRKLAGAGGFINISQNAKKLVFAGTFTTGGLKSRNRRTGSLAIMSEGQLQKFIEKVEQITFSGDYAAETGQPVLLRDRALRLPTHVGGMELIEIAPGIDIERDILPTWTLSHLVNDPTTDGPERIFRREPMGLEQHSAWPEPLAERISYDQLRNILFINLEGFQVRTVDDVDLVRREVGARCQAIGRKVALVVNYDGFHLDPVVSDAYFSMITYMQQPLLLHSLALHDERFHAHEARRRSRRT